MERGFKTRCENMARSWRAKLGLTPFDPLDAEQFAKHLDVLVLPVSELGLSDEDLRQLIKVDADSWSAFAVSAFGKDAIIFNPTHSKGRYASDLMHELAHLILGHQPNTVFFMENEDFALRGYNRSVEEEADWLSGALLLPRDALVHIRRQRIGSWAACERYSVSEQMLMFRMNVTGVNRQFGRTHG